MKQKNSRLAVLLFTMILFFVPAYSADSYKKLPIKPQRESKEDLFQLFRSPDNRHYPYARWWWNGSRITEEEINRQLDVMKEAGIMGVEINTIKLEDDIDPLHYPSHPVLGDEWLRLINVAADGCEKRGMVCDMILGSGWPYGGEFLSRDEQIQMLTIETFDIDGGSNGFTFSINRGDILDKVNPPILSPGEEPVKELMYLRLMPKQVNEFTEGIAFDELVKGENISIDVPQGQYVLYCFVKLTGYMYVIEGAPGASGPVLNHFDGKAVKGYLDHFSTILDFKDGPLKGKIRSAFTDSFELEGANWSFTMLDEFEKRMGYSLYPYLPYIIDKIGQLGDRVNEEYGSEFSTKVTEEIVNRVRNDFEHVKVEVFHENFVDVYTNWCHHNGLKARVQAYGRDLHPIESAMYIDIPESETWHWSEVGVDFRENESVLDRNYGMVNKLVASGSRFSGNNIVSCEEVTNVANIFQLSLEEIKIIGDKSNLSGVNHSVLHGYNYSPEDAVFPGWIKFGTYFSENNTWWPYMRLWTDYKARVSAILQNSKLQADIAVLLPFEDLWSKFGQQRDPFPSIVYPDYAYNLWEAIHQNGNGCDFVTERIIQQSKIKNGQLIVGNCSFKTIFLFGVSSLAPKTARLLSDFVAKGGRVMCIGETPYQSWGMNDAAKNSAETAGIINKIKASHPARFIEIPAPTGNLPLHEWFANIQRQYGIAPMVKIEKPNKFFSQNYYKSKDRDIFYLINYSIDESMDMTFGFPNEVKGKQAWLWDAETGERYMFPESGNTLKLHLGPAETKFVVFDTERNGKTLPPCIVADSIKPIEGLWTLKTTHIDKTVRSVEIDRLVDLNTLPFPWLRHFAGVLEYTTEVNVDDPTQCRILDAGLTHNGVTELIVNGELVGVKWYGERRFDVSEKLKKGANTITIKVTTLLGNYAKSLEGNPVAQRWANEQSYRPIGLAGPVRLY